MDRQQPARPGSHRPTLPSSPTVQRTTRRSRTRAGKAAGPGARLRVSSPEDLLGLAPYLLGFTPTESLVLIVIGDGRVLVTARLDLPAPAAHEQVAEQLLGIADRVDASGLVLLAYSADGEAARALLERLIVPLRPAGLLDALYVDATRWWSLMCTAGCCPSEGVRYEPAAHPMAAEAVYAGLTAAAGRADIVARVSGPPETDVARLEQVSHAVGAELVELSPQEAGELMAALVAGYLDQPGPLSDAECVRLAILAADLTVRDVAWAAMTREDVDDHLSLWGQVVARTIAPWEPAPLCLLGMAAWISGDGALQNCCADRALGLDPSYSMAALLDEINRRVLPPSFWDVLSAEMTRELGPLAGLQSGR